MSIVIIPVGIDKVSNGAIKLQEANLAVLGLKDKGQN